MREGARERYCFLSRWLSGKLSVTSIVCRSCAPNIDKGRRIHVWMAMPLLLSSTGSSCFAPTGTSFTCVASRLVVLSLATAMLGLR